MNELLAVRLAIKEGPVVIRKGVTDSGINASYELWHGATASEYFPPKAESAFYVITLEKSAFDAGEVRSVERELTETLFLLAAAWPFSGGSHMVLEMRQLISTPRFSSNAEQIEQDLLARSGLLRVTASTTLNWGVLATYVQPPLRPAIEIATRMRRDFPTKRLLQYYDSAWVAYYHSAAIGRSSWFIELYKVRDLLTKIHQGGNGKVAERVAAKAVRAALGVSASEWSKFGRLLNENDLRHAEITGTAPPILKEDVAWLFAAARKWIVAYLRGQSLPVVG